jgi:predicted DCC family thiol-disulfide oxidoreductase YuxK
MPTEHRHPIILFDGVCNLCARSVQFVIRNDRDGRFRFAPLQSVAGQRLLGEHRYRDSELSSVLLIEDGQIFRKSRAALRIAHNLDGAWPVFYFLFSWVPAFASDWIYDFIGNRRYRWFGRKQECWIPDEDLQSRFLEDSDALH